MNSASSAVIPETLGLIVREYLKALRPESSGRSAALGTAPREQASSRWDGHFSDDLSEAFCRPVPAKR
jgi:hypothetical protein